MNAPMSSHSMPDYTSRLRVDAIKLGCSPEWLNGQCGWGWHCGCRDNAHGYDQQNSLITASSLSRYLHRRSPDRIFTVADKQFLKALNITLEAQ